ncbi:MAG TPA: antibiotic biosynthesis monooxygenase [Clostridia bacterium]|nr:antibiotic biosynthesis monooxygenase [Clostridia bacterium]
MSEIVKAPSAPYYAVIFTSIRTPDDNGYGQIGDSLMKIVSEQKGFLGAESVRGPDGFGMTISYWDSLKSIEAWKHHPPHMKAQEAGKKLWYSEYAIRVCKVERDNYFSASLYPPL